MNVESYKSISLKIDRLPLAVPAVSLTTLGESRTVDTTLLPVTSTETSALLSFHPFRV